MSVKPIDIEHFSNVGNDIYEAIVVTSKRARQIHQDMKIELSQRLETLAQLTATPETEEEADISANPDQLKISLEFEQRPKPTEVGLNEMMDKRLEWRFKEMEQAPPEEKEKEAE